MTNNRSRSAIRFGSSLVVAVVIPALTWAAKPASPEPAAIPAVSMDKEFSGTLDETTPLWQPPSLHGPVPAVQFRLQGKRETRIVGEIRATSGFKRAPPMLSLVHDGRVVAASNQQPGEKVGVLNALLPEDGEYRLVVLAGSGDEDDTITLRPVGDYGRFTARLRYDRDLPATRAGDFHLAHADRHHAWFVDLKTLKRSGDLATFHFIERSSESYERDGKPLHSARSTLEVNCRKEAYRTTALAARLEDGERHLLEDFELSEEARAWKPMGHRAHVLRLVCKPGPHPHLRWSDLDLAVDAYHSALDRFEAEEDGIHEDAGKIPLRAVTLGETVEATLSRQPRRFMFWPFDGYRFTVKPGERFDVDVRADFRPYLRLRVGDTYIASSYDEMRGGLATPVGDLSLKKEAEVVVEVTSLDSGGSGKYALTVRRLPPKADKK